MMGWLVMCEADAAVPVLAVLAVESEATEAGSGAVTGSVHVTVNKHWTRCLAELASRRTSCRL